MEFEYDIGESAANKSRHGMDFDEVQVLWNDSRRLQIPLKEAGETRYLVIGKIKGGLWSAIISHRGKNIRLVGARPARKEEAELYEKNGI